MGKRRVTQGRRSHSHHPSKGTLPGGSAGALKAFWPSRAPRARAEVASGEVAHRSLPSAVSWAPKGFAPSSKDVTVATAGRSQRRCQMWRGSVRSSPWKALRDIHQAGAIYANPGHPSVPRTFHLFQEHPS